MSAVQRLISFFSSREGSPQEQEESPLSSFEPTVREPRFFDLKREAPDLTSAEELGKQIRGENLQSFRNNPQYAHYFRGEEDVRPVAQVGGFFTQETREIPKVSYEFQRPIQPKPKVSPASIESPPQFENLPDDILDVLKPTTGEAPRLGNTVEGTFQRGGLIIPSTAPRKPVLREQPRPAPARPPPAQPALPEPQATPSVAPPPPPPVSRNVEPQSAPTQTPQVDRPAQPISQIPDYAPLTDDEEEEIQKATTDVQGASVGAETASKVFKGGEGSPLEETEQAVKTAGKTISGTSSFLAGSEGFVNPILDGIGLIGGLASLLMGSGLFSKKPPTPPQVSLPKPQAIVIPTISQTVGGGQI
jgi:hypothetical protein